MKNELEYKYITHLCNYQILFVKTLLTHVLACITAKQNLGYLGSTGWLEHKVHRNKKPRITTGFEWLFGYVNNTGVDTHNTLNPLTKIVYTNSTSWLKIWRSRFP